MKYIIILLLISATSLITQLITQKHDTQRVSKRIEALFGGGDTGSDVHYHLLVEDEQAFEEYIKTLEE